METTLKVAGIDIHKKMLAVVMTDASQTDELSFERRTFGTGDQDLRDLAAWLSEQGVQQVVMESTAQYWRPVWQCLEPVSRLHLAQAQSNRAPKGRKRDFADAERLVRRFLAGELILSFVPDAQQRLWRTLTRSKYQLTRDRVRLRNQMEGLLEEARIKLSSHVSDLFGVSGRKMLQALAEGVSEPQQIAALAVTGLRATPEALADALSGAVSMDALQRNVLRLFLERLDLLERHIETLRQSAAQALREHQEAVARLAEVPGLGADSAHQIIAEVGPQAAAFPSAGQLASWVGCCPGREESAQVSKSDQSPKGSRHMRHILSQCANAAVKTKGSIFQQQYQRLVNRIGHPKAIWAVAHKLCRIIWKILYERVPYEERGYRTDANAIRRRAGKLVRQLRQLGFQVQLTTASSIPLT